jgi:hypothetical protein
MKQTIFYSLGLSAILGASLLAGCTQAPPSDIKKKTAEKEVSDDPTKDPAQPGAYSAGDKNTFDHFSDLGADGARDPFDILAQRQEEGPPEVRTRLHSCQKVTYATLGNILGSFGVDMDATAGSSAAQLYKNGAGALGVANYDARVGESITWSSAGAAKLFDIFVQAAPEVIANIETLERCQVDGAGTPMFDAQDKCNADAISCLIGRPATSAHVAICNNLVTSASDVAKGKNIAVATMLAAAHSCE